MTDLPHRAFIGLGANLGARTRQLQRALTRLRASPRIAVVRVSSFIETEPVGGPPDQPKYLNATAELRTSLSPRALLDCLLQAEKQLGRDRSITVRNAPRTIDLDLLLYDDKIIKARGLHVPHPRMHEREFVLRPLNEIAPEAVHPTLKKTMKQLLARLRGRKRRSP